LFKYQSAGKISSTILRAATLSQPVPTALTKFQGDPALEELQRNTSEAAFKTLFSKPLIAIMAEFDGSMNETNFGISGFPRPDWGLTCGRILISLTNISTKELATEKQHVTIPGMQGVGEAEGTEDVGDNVGDLEGVEVVGENEGERLGEDVVGLVDGAVVVVGETEGE
jgi:hypothetical protein